jgi:hypothetical protein
VVITTFCASPTKDSDFGNKKNDNNDWVAQKLNFYSSKLKWQLAMGAVA